MAIADVRKAVPWWLRIGAKLVLARLPIPYGFWKRVRLFEHGDMNQPQRAMDIVLAHARAAGVIDDSARPPRFIRCAASFGVLELGPGDSLFSCLISKALGASQSWLVDAGPFATTDVASYMALSDFLQHKGYPGPLTSPPDNLAAVLTQCNSAYLTTGTQSLPSLPPASIDFCFSNAVLEHVPKDEFPKLADELMRLMKPDGVCLHRVDLKDHLGGGLNNLRFSAAIWEGPIFRDSGFYTNRIRFREMVRIFEQAGFACALPRISRWDDLPLPRARLDASFRALAQEDLLVNGFDIVLRRKKVSS